MLNRELPLCCWSWYPSFPCWVSSPLVLCGIGEHAPQDRWRPTPIALDHCAMHSIPLAFLCRARFSLHWYHGQLPNGSLRPCLRGVTLHATISCKPQSPVDTAPLSRSSSAAVDGEIQDRSGSLGRYCGSMAFRNSGLPLQIFRWLRLRLADSQQACYPSGSREIRDSATTRQWRSRLSSWTWLKATPDSGTCRRLSRGVDRPSDSSTGLASRRYTS